MKLAIRIEQVHRYGGPLQLLETSESRISKFVGRSYVHREERRSESSGTQQRHVTYMYTSEHQCADQVSSDGKLGAAKYSWPFSFAIPPLAPSFFEGTVGNIYATPSKPESEQACSSLTILSSVGVNAVPL